MIILMLFTLPLQASWGAVVAYSSHELMEARLEHVAHGDEAHGKIAKSTAIGNAPSDVDDDCAVCHLAHHANVILPPLGLSAPICNLVLFNTPVSNEALFVSLPSPRPERPKWSAAV